MKRRQDSKINSLMVLLKVLRYSSFLSALLIAGLTLPVMAEDAELNSDQAAVTENESSAKDASQDNASVDAKSPVSDQIESLKNEVISLNRDLFILEEELLFPASTQTAVFLSMNVGDFFNLDAVELKVDNRTVTHYLYTERQISALFRGGMQRLWIGNLKTGTHEISAFFIGKGPNGRDYRRAASLSFEKTTDPKMLELRISDSTEIYQPVFEVVEWQ